MAIFDTSKSYFDVTDWRTQDSGVFERCTVYDWDDDIKFISQANNRVGDGQTSLNDDSVQFESEYKGNYKLGLKTYNMYSDVQLEDFFKSLLSKTLGGGLTNTLINGLSTSNKIHNVDGGIDEAIKKLGTEYLRRQSLMIVLPIDADIIDNNTGYYKGIRTVYSPYMTVTPRTEGQPYGLIVDLDDVWVAQYQDNKLRELYEEGLANAQKLFQYYYKFKFGVKGSYSCAVFNVKR